MKIRYLPLLTTLVFLGFTVSAFAKGKPTNFPDYDVLIAGAVSGESVASWGYNGKQVYSQRGRNEEMNLNYFRAFFDSGKGERCFGDIDAMTNFGGFLRKHKKGAANGMFWFVGSTGDTPIEPVLYLLVVTGEFVFGPAGWPENGNVEDGNLMVMPNWTLKVENEGTDVASRSCEGSGEWTAEKMMIVSVY